MEWIKIPTDSILHTDLKDKELITIIRYQALYSQLEIEPNLVQLKRLFSSKQITFIEENKQIVDGFIKKHIKSKLVPLADKTRLDKNIVRDGEKFSLINEDFIDDVFKFKKIVESAGKLTDNNNLDSWATALRLLNKKVGDTQYHFALNWYSKKIGQPYIPQCYSAVTFRNKWAKIVNQIQGEKQNG